MSNVVIKIENLYKEYQLGTIGYGSLKHDLNVWLAKIRGKDNPYLKIGEKKHKDLNETFMALNNINLEIEAGDTVGIIGKNGAGKSTLFKILSRTTAPTKGQVKIKGKIASLLEVGTGFHPELTGRENIFLNGAILGMKKREISKKFDEIVAFSGIEQFIDTPVKRYSSGMYVRLAFAVAAHLDSDILILDEVLAVGDAEFQKKCLGKMDDVAKNQGRTVLFVSHNMAAVSKLCKSGVLLKNGVVQYNGNSSDAISRYLASDPFVNSLLSERPDMGPIKITKIEIRDKSNNVVDTVQSGDDLSVCLYFEKKTKDPISNIIVSITLKTPLDIPVFNQHNRITGDHFGYIPNRGVFICYIKKLPLPASNYTLSFSIIPDNGRSNEYCDYMEQAFEINVVSGDFYGSGEVPPISHGVCLVDAKWSIEETN